MRCKRARGGSRGPVTKSTMSNRASGPTIRPSWVERPTAARSAARSGNEAWSSSKARRSCPKTKPTSPAQGHSVAHAVASRAAIGSRAPRRPGAVRALTGRRTSVWAAVMAVLMLAGTLGAVFGARAVASSEAAKARLAFRSASAEIASNLRMAIQHEEDLVISASAFITAIRTRLRPRSTAGWNRCTRCSATRSCRTSVCWRTCRRADLPRSRRASRRSGRAMGPDAAGPKGSFQILPSGRRPYYCLAVAGLARNAATYLPAGLDYCQLAPQLVLDRTAGLTGYAPFPRGAPRCWESRRPCIAAGWCPRRGGARTGVHRLAGRADHAERAAAESAVLASGHRRGVPV